MCICITIAWHFTPRETYGFDVSMPMNLILFFTWLMYAISVDSKILSNKVMKFMSGISLELYLAQMIIFRVVEKAKCLYLFGTGWISFVVVWIIVVAGLIVFVELWRQISQIVSNKIIYAVTRHR